MFNWKPEKKIKITSSWNILVNQKHLKGHDELGLKGQKMGQATEELHNPQGMRDSSQGSGVCMEPAGNVLLDLQCSDSIFSDYRSQKIYDDIVRFTF